MNKKRIWMIAVVFGLITTAIFYSKVMRGPTQSVATTPSVEISEEMEGESTNGDQEEPMLEEGPVEEEPIEVELLEIEEGKRAVSIEVDSVTGVSGFLEAGDFVDIILTYPPVKMHEEPFAVILYENIKVLATGERSILSSHPTNTPYGTVTLELAAIEGAKLSLASEKGRIVLMLRPKDDSSTSSEVHLDESDLH